MFWFYLVFYLSSSRHLEVEWLGRKLCVCICMYAQWAGNKIVYEDCVADV